MQILRTIQELKTWQNNLKPTTPQEQRLGFVPTMGALHAGHLSLIHQSTLQNQKTVVSIFVNPLQFGPNEDLSKYPRTEELDLALCKEAKVSAVFLPAVEELYGKDLNNAERTLKVTPPTQLSNCLCGSSRIGHFDGVLTIVAKLFNLVQPTRAYFGEKDFQQLVIVKNMVSALNFPLQIIAGPTVRETEAAYTGLAMSSRNKYLEPQAKAKAAELYKCLQATSQELKDGKTISDSLENARQELKNKHPEFQLEYLEVRDSETLSVITQLNPAQTARIFIAARIGQTRLIDNIAIN